MAWKGKIMGRSILLRWLITTLAICMVPYVVSGVSVEGFGAAMFAAAVLGILNSLVRPVLIILTLPLTVVTLGLFLLVINTLMFLLAGSIAPGFHVESFWSALFGSIIVSIVSWMINGSILPEHESATFVVRSGASSEEPDAFDLRKDRGGKWR
jgi:putative membrane protein